jgi:hypothetical protein
MKQTSNLFLLENNMSFSLCPAFHTAPFSPTNRFFWRQVITFQNMSTNLNCKETGGYTCPRVIPFHLDKSMTPLVENIKIGVFYGFYGKRPYRPFFFVNPTFSFRTF